MLLGLVVHGGSFAATYQQPTGTLGDNIGLEVTILTHSFRMPAFFLVSGILAAMLLSKRGAKRFWNQRQRRLLYPLIGGCLTIIPLTYLALGTSPKDPLDLINNGFMHLWFIYYLLIFSGLLIALELTLKNWGASIAGTQKRGLGFWLVNPISISLLAVATLALPSWFSGDLEALSQNSSLLPPLGLIVFYLTFFAFGVMVYRYWSSAEIWLRRFAPLYLLLGAAAFANYTIHIWGGDHPLDPRLSYALSTWMLSLGIVAIFILVFKKQNRVIRYLSDASYWVYLVHLPIMIALQRWFALQNLGFGISFWTSVPLVFGISIGLYQWFVRERFVGKFLAGRL